MAENVLEKVLSLSLIALLGIGSFQALGNSTELAIADRTEGHAPSAEASFNTAAFNTAAPHSTLGGLPALVTKTQAGIATALADAARLAKRVVGGADVAVESELSRFATRSAGASVLDELKKYADKLPDEAWKSRLVPGVDPNTPWRDLDIVAIDLEGKINEPTQIGLVKISGRELGNEVTLRITPSSGEATPKATRLRLLDSSKTVSNAGTFEESRYLFEDFSKGRVPLAFQHQGDLSGLMKEWSRPGKSNLEGIHAVRSDVEWIDVANWTRILNYGDRNSLSHAHWRVLDEGLLGAHVGVNDARGAARVLYRLGEQHPDMPKTYGELVKYQVAWRKYRSEVSEMQASRLQTAIDEMTTELTEAFEAKKAELLAKRN